MNLIQAFDNYVLTIPKHFKFEDEFYLRERELMTLIGNILKLDM